MLTLELWELWSHEQAGRRAYSAIEDICGYPNPPPHLHSHQSHHRMRNACLSPSMLRVPLEERLRVVKTGPETLHTQDCHDLQAIDNQGCCELSRVHWVSWRLRVKLLNAWEGSLDQTELLCGMPKSRSGVYRFETFSLLHLLLHPSSVILCIAWQFRTRESCLQAEIGTRSCQVSRTVPLGV